MKALDYINIHTHAHSSAGISIMNIFPSENFIEIPGNLYSIGLHPWHIDIKDQDTKIGIVRNWARSNSCLAIGETGLDKLTKISFILQKTIFEKHVEIAEDHYKPLIIHCVRAFDELIVIKKKSGSKVPWIVHGFNSKPQVAEKLITEGMILSFGKALTKQGSNAQRTLKLMADNEFFLETDDSNLSIEDIYGFAANIRRISLNTLKKIIERNFKQSF